MRRTSILLVALALVVLGASPALAASNHNVQLRGANEVPPVETQAQGHAKFTVSEESISFKLFVANIEGATQAHIHCGAAGVNGPVVAFLFGLDPAGVSTSGFLSSGTIEAGDVIPVSDSVACPGGVADFDDLLAKIAAGEAYVNVHTIDNPGGEIRGQF